MAHNIFSIIGMLGAIAALIGQGYLYRAKIDSMEVRLGAQEVELRDLRLVSIEARHIKKSLDTIESTVDGLRRDVSAGIFQKLAVLEERIANIQRKVDGR